MIFILLILTLTFAVVSYVYDNMRLMISIWFSIKSIALSPYIITYASLLVFLLVLKMAGTKEWGHYDIFM